MGKVRCIVTGKGSKGAIIVCETPHGDVVLKALKTGAYKYEVYSEHPRNAYKQVFLAKNIRNLRKKLEQWLDYLLTRPKTQRTPSATPA